MQALAGKVAAVTGGETGMVLNVSAGRTSAQFIGRAEKILGIFSKILNNSR